jgi:hypothetical protein
LNHIEWTEGKYFDHTGRVAGHIFFVIHWGMKREDPKPWKLDNKLPIAFKGKDFATVDEAKAHAEAILTKFLDVIGAQWKSE